MTGSVVPRWAATALVAAIVLATPLAQAAVYDAPPEGSDIIGAVRSIRAEYEDTFVAIARRQNLGFNELRLANPQVDAWLPGAGTKIVLPTRYILPDAPREGLVLNIAEMRLYYYPPEGSPYAGKVITYPMGIGREGWGTPLGHTRVVRTVAGPTWYPPESIRKEHAAAGDPLPQVVPAGPDNPLGEHALYLGYDSYLIHGTNKPAGIGLRVSHGCIRLFPEDIAALYAMVEPGTPVTIVYQPYKVGWHQGQLYLEAHPPDATGEGPVKTYTPLVRSIIQATEAAPKFPVDWDQAQSLAAKAQGVPVPIGSKRIAQRD